MVASGILAAISSGLLATFTPYTSVGKWIGYQILSGSGRGLGMQIVSTSHIIFISLIPLLTLFQGHRRRPKRTPAGENSSRNVDPRVFPGFWRSSVPLHRANDIQRGASFGFG